MEQAREVDGETEEEKEERERERKRERKGVKHALCVLKKRGSDSR
jgi:hypothetical protein